MVKKRFDLFNYHSLGLGFVLIGSLMGPQVNAKPFGAQSSLLARPTYPIAARVGQFVQNRIVNPLGMLRTQGALFSPRRSELKTPLKTSFAMSSSFQRDLNILHGIAFAGMGVSVAGAATLIGGGLLGASMPILMGGAVAAVLGPIVSLVAIDCAFNKAEDRVLDDLHAVYRSGHL